MPDRTGRLAVGAAMLVLVVFALGVFILPFAFPTPPPIVTRFGSSQLFSPNGDRARDVARVSVRMRERGQVTLEVTDGDRVVRRLAQSQQVGRGWFRVGWDGRDDAGARVPDGGYALRLRARSGRKVFNTSRRIRLDTTPPGVLGVDVVTPPPGPGGIECAVTVTPAEDSAVRLEALPGPVAAAAARAVRALGPRPVAGGDRFTWSWDGRAANGRLVRAGVHLLRVTVRDAARNATTVDRTCWVGHLRGTIGGPAPRPGDAVQVRLQRPTGAPLRPGARVRLRLFRRTGTPGTDALVLGAPVARPVSARAGRARIRLPRTRRVDALWLVVRSADGGRALVDPARP